MASGSDTLAWEQVGAQDTGRDLAAMGLSASERQQDQVTAGAALQVHGGLQVKVVGGLQLVGITQVGQIGRHPAVG